MVILSLCWESLTSCKDLYIKEDLDCTRPLCRIWNCIQDNSYNTYTDPYMCSVCYHEEEYIYIFYISSTSFISHPHSSTFFLTLWNFSDCPDLISLSYVFFYRNNCSINPLSCVTYLTIPCYLMLSDFLLSVFWEWMVLQWSVRLHCWEFSLELDSVISL